MKRFLDLCRERRSVRNYRPDVIPDDVLAYVMECVRSAPSAANRQPWKFIGVRLEARRKLLHRCYGREWFQTAPYYFIVCRDKEQEWVRKLDEKPHGDIDVSIATEHLCLAAAEQGLGTCWVCNFDVPLCKELFAIPEHLEPVVIIPIGYPADEAVVESSRKPMEDVWVQPVME